MILNMRFYALCSSITTKKSIGVKKSSTIFNNMTKNNTKINKMINILGNILKLKP